MRCRAATGVVLAAALFIGSPAAASPSAKLVYVRGAGAEACPAEAELRKAVAVRIGYDPFFPVAQKTVVAQVSRVTGGYRGRVQIVGDDGSLRGERELATKGDDCGELVSSMALAVSVALDDLDEPAAALPAEAEPAAAAPPVPDPDVEMPAPAPEPERAAAPEAPPPSAPVQLALAAGPTVAFGSAPAPVAGASLGAALGYRSVAFRIDVRGDLPAGDGIVPSGRVVTTGFVAVASACIRGQVPFACVGGGSGLVASRTEGLARPATDAAALAVIVGRIGVDVPLGSTFFLEPFVDVGANLARHRVEVDQRSVYEMPLVWGAGGILVGVKVF